ncbi:hypothetical protein OKW50_007976 [Paraburkholderia youngii]
MRDVERQLDTVVDNRRAELQELTARTKLILTQKTKDKNKLYGKRSSEAVADCVEEQRGITESVQAPDRFAASANSRVVGLSIVSTAHSAITLPPTRVVSSARALSTLIAGDIGNGRNGGDAGP